MRRQGRYLSFGALTLGILGGVFVMLAGCTTVKFVQKNPYTGEIWTVYSHLGSDTVTYCPPNEGGNCVEAELANGPPPAQIAPPATPPAQ